MSTQSKTMPMLDLKMYVRVVAAVFSISSATAFVLALIRLLNPDLFYLDPLVGNEIGIHYFISGLMIVTSGIGFLNSCVVMNRSASHNTGRNITTWLLLDSLFETTRVVYVFVCEILLKGKGPMQLYELLISAAQYLLDSFLYCQMILRH
ncbi:uncharacterized protein LOC110381236 isoform X2 [Helicoverpa armigera]|uniref:Uncharacterized protein n=1 Tax=Helicoverpa armigera TaxID=29058 RepID=A0A2W1BHT2_HELAM|nr:uncharacterized protein LOC110381236 isoform X2 [Helicoverpa armigera]XP_047021929.1 uncharacterized protein LOC124631521 isoform X2 [Helicoverpa zea]PZC72767.1 hypothetical protein B5X24_HaOG210608 [Helicoverpa armigera]